MLSSKGARKRHQSNLDQNAILLAAIQLLFVICCFSLSSLVIVVHGHPMLLVNSGRPKCMTIEVPGKTVIRVSYEAPDIRFGLTYITLLEKPVETLLDELGDAGRIAERRMQQQERNKHKPQPVSQELRDTKGSFVHRIHQDATADLCIRAASASASNPMRFHLRVEEVGDFDPDDLEKKALGASQHWTFLEVQMDRIEREMHSIIAEADFFKEKDAIYHQHMDDMHKATTFWPMLHVSILLITGFTQANHIVRFFQSRRII
ncbi:emp24/gp25L/p24 family protein [Nitzschia inconspicua]|uniref:Emp24/gp25L/p24 family protein n=1 Tax=Nitzschia inconspicua TaxID=303405 RepID=A0A9K3PYT6_9STRA|nr:emp24/gp25L/p24 family protein [Nitzschia inconspicua]